MPHHLKKCSKCHVYSISDTNCHICGGKLESIYPPKFSIQDKYQSYRLDYFKQKMIRKFPELAKPIEKRNY